MKIDLSKETAEVITRLITVLERLADAMEASIKPWTTYSTDEMDED